MSAEVEMELVRVEIHEKLERQVIQLRESEGTRSIQIVIGYGEAAEIHRKLTGSHAPRPMTHDLIGKILATVGASIDRIIVNDLVDSTYYAQIRLGLADGTPAEIDARPSDAIALAVQTGARIFAVEKVLDLAV